ncbi:MAG: hypothetical protein EBT27_08835 [Betaproteobacteria bacterium]|nr:hypothetical protein [Betaproteobacteria bacterium]
MVHAAVGRHHQAAAVEHQLVLAAHRIDVDQRQASLGDTLPQHRFAGMRLVEVIRRRIEHDNALRTGRLKVGGDVRLPDVLADRYADALARQLKHGGRAAFGKVALLVEHLGVGQMAFVRRGLHTPAKQQRGRVKQGFAGPVRMAHQQRQRRLRRQLGQARRAVVKKMAAQ